MSMKQEQAIPASGTDLTDPAEDAEEGLASKGEIGEEGWRTDSYRGLTTAQVEASLEKWGPNEIPTHITPTWWLFVRQFLGFMPILIEVAAIISLALQDYPDFGIICAMLIINATLGFHEEYKAKKSLEELSSSIESEIAVIRDGTTDTHLVSKLVPGDIVMLVGGTTIPADVKWIRGDKMSIDTAALTGEPLPRKYPGEHGDVMLAGTTVKDGECYAQIMKTGTHTEMGAAQADVMKDKSVAVVSVFERKIMLVVQCTISFSLCFVIAVILVEGIARNGFQEDIAATILDGLAILIAAIPIALPLVMQVNMALGAAFLAKEHSAIVTSLPALQDIASMSILCSDKTGTLTTAKMSIITDSIIAVDDFTATEVLLYAYLAANEDKKDDPIDRAIVNAFKENNAAQELMTKEKYKQESLIGFNPEVKRVIAFASTGGKSSSDGKRFSILSTDEAPRQLTIAKGLVAKILDTAAGGKDSGEIQWRVEQADDKQFLATLQEKDKTLSEAGYKTIGIAVCEGDAREMENPKFRFVGLLPMLDPPREDTALTISSLHNANISVKMITGDHVNVGRETARLIGLGTDIKSGELIRTTPDENTKKQMVWEADGFASVLPSDKRECVMILKNDFGVVTGMTGDGVNDAPALSAAQVGIAVEGATDAAKNAADLILTEPGLSPIYGAVIEARRIFARIKAYVVYRIAASLTMVLVLSLVSFISACNITPLYIIILALLNDVSMIPVAYDNAEATKRPQLPRATNLVLISSYFALFQTGMAMLLFYAVGLHSDKIPGFELNPQLDGHCNGSTQGFIWLHLVMCTEFMIFSARAPGFFWSSMPSWKLLLSVFVTVGPICCIIAAFDKQFRVPGVSIGWLWLANAIIFVISDIGKVWFKAIIHDQAGEVIKGDGLIGEKEGVEESEAKKKLEKDMRYQVHRDSILSEDEREPEYVIFDRKKFGANFGKRLKTGSSLSGFIRPPNMGTKIPGFNNTP